jgi:hypothetical protein
VSDPHPARERELAQDSVKSVGQILSNYQAALHLFEEAVTGDIGETVPPQLGLELLRTTAREMFAPVLEACAGVAPGLDDLVSEAIGGVGDAPAAERQMRDLVVAERERVAITHSRLITRQARLMDVAEEGGHRAALVTAAARLEELQTGSHSAGALFNVLLERWNAVL